MGGWQEDLNALVVPACCLFVSASIFLAICFFVQLHFDLALLSTLNKDFIEFGSALESKISGSDRSMY